MRMLLAYAAATATAAAAAAAAVACCAADGIKCAFGGEWDRLEKRLFAVSVAGLNRHSVMYVGVRGLGVEGSR